MAKPKKILKAKEPIRLRAKELSNGSKSLYFDIYMDGKRSYEFLKLYLIPETDEISKERNANTMQAANTIKAQRIIELTNEKAGIKRADARSRMLLTDWMERYRQHKEKTGQSGSYSVTVSNTISYLIKYKGDAVMLKDVDKSFCSGFMDYLKTAEGDRGGKPLSKSSAFLYFACFNSALNFAVKEEVISYNPISKISSDEKIRKPESTREYLTINEVKTLINTRCGSERTKNAYLFSCFCGMRWSDIQALTWGDIAKDGNQYRAKIIMQKTRKPLYVPLSDEALKWIPIRGNAKDADKVFSIPSEQCSNRVLKTWARNAGISKRLTFHTARHTFATMLLTLGADLYTASKLLGHTDIKITAIYAKIVDKKKDEAVNLINEAFNK